MTKDRSDPSGAAAPSAGKPPAGKPPLTQADRRAARAAAALRENLKRRKAQERGRAASAPEPAKADAPAESAEFVPDKPNR